MESPAQHRDGVLVISAWIDGETGDFRARVMQTTEPGTSEHEISWAATPAEVLAMVEDWLGGLADPAV